MAFVHISEHAKLASLHMEGRMTGKIKSFLTPWKKLNQVGIDGIELNSITTIAAMSGAGKTVASNQITSESFDLDPNSNHLVLDFNFEMIGRNLVMRNISANLNMTMKHLNSTEGDKMTREELNTVNRYINEVLCKKPIYIVDTPTGVLGIKEELYRFYDKFKRPFLATLDHSILTKKSVSESNMLETLYNLGEMCTETKKQLPMSWIILTQLNREIEEADRVAPKKPSSIQFPMKKDIFGGDALYQHSDIVFVIHRPYALGIKLYGPESIPIGKDSLFFHCLKVRNGEPRHFEMKADFASMKIVDKDYGGMAEPIPLVRNMLSTRNIKKDGEQGQE